MVTRITNTMLTNRLMSNLSLNLNNLDKLNNQLSTGRKYAHISDDPSALIYGQAARNKIARLSHYKDTVGTAQNWLMQVEAGVMELQGMVGNVYEELINAGGPKTLADRQNIGMMVNQIRNHYLDTLNASFGDRFVFGGYNTPGDYVDGRVNDIKPFTFDDDGNLLFNGFNISQFDGLPVGMLVINANIDPDDPAAVAALEAAWTTEIMKIRDENGDLIYTNAATAVADFFADNPLEHTTIGPPPVTINDGEVIMKMHRMMNDVISFDVGPGISIPVTMNGLDLLFYATQDEYGNAVMRNMYEVLNEVHGSIVGDPKYNNVNGVPITVDDGDEIRGLTRLINLLQDGQNHLLVKTADIGGRTRRLDLLEARYQGDEINYETMRSDAEDADIAEVIMYLRMAETVYQAALSSGARIIQPTLMDFLR